MTTSGVEPANVQEVKQIWLDPAIGRPDSQRLVSFDLMNAVGDMHNLEIFGVGMERIHWSGIPIRTDYPEWISFCDDHLPPLFRLKNLKELYLDNTFLTDNGLLALADHETLRFIEVNHSFVTDEGIEAFRKRRPDCIVVRMPRGVTFYDRLTGVVHGDGTADKLAYAKEVPFVTEIRSTCKREDCHQTIEGSDLQGVERLQSLRIIDLEGASGLEDADLTPLRDLPKIELINLTGTRISSAAIQELRNAHPRADIRQAGGPVERSALTGSRNVFP